MSDQVKKIVLVVMFALTLIGCASAPPPPECKGEFKPVNQLNKNAELNGDIKIVRCGEGELNGNKG